MLYYHKFALLSRGKRKILKNVFSFQNINPKDWPRGMEPNLNKNSLLFLTSA